VTRLTATGTHMPYGITQYYLPPGRGDIPAVGKVQSGKQINKKLIQNNYNKTDL